MRKRRNCPVCGFNETISGSQVRAPIVAENQDFETLTKYWRGLTDRSCFFTYERCCNCKVLYCPIYFSDTELEILYSNMGDNNYSGVNERTLERTQRGYFNFVKKYLRTESFSYLELGPDTGILSKIFLENGALKQALIEPNEAIHVQLSESVKGAREFQILDNLKKVSTSAKYDFISGIHVVDHIVDINSLFNDLLRLSIAGTRVLIVVHDEMSLLRKILNSKWPPFCLQHPHLFNPYTIEFVLNNFGFEDVLVKKSVNWFPIRELAETAFKVIGIPSSWVKYLPSFEIPIKFGNLQVTATCRSNIPLQDL